MISSCKMVLFCSLLLLLISKVTAQGSTILGSHQTPPTMSPTPTLTVQVPFGTNSRLAVTRSLVSSTQIATASSLLSTQTTSSVVTPTPSPVPYVLFANRNAIRRVNLDQSGLQTVIGNTSLLQNVIALDYDLRLNFLFWTDVQTRQILMSNLTGDNVTVLIDDGVAVADGLVWDWVSKKLYWSDAEHREIEVLDPYTGDRRQLVFTGVDTIPRGVIVDPIITRCIYWTDWGSEARIERASLDGAPETREVLHNTSLVWPNDLTLDFSTLTLYWVDAFLDKVESSHIDGTNRTLLTRLVFHPFSITVFDNTLYWSDWSLDQILITPLSNPGIVGALIPRLNTEPMAVKVVDLSKQPLGADISPCSLSNGNCSHLCLLSSVDPGGYSCSCPRGMVLTEDRQSCANITVIVPPGITPPPEGSCAAAGYTDCCTGSSCLGIPPTCFCDTFCFETDSCCSDFSSVCQTDYLVFANRQFIHRLELDSFSLRTLYAKSGSNFVGFDYDYRREFLYWTDLVSGQIFRSNSRGQQRTIVVNGSLEVPDGLAVDWLTNKLYWSEAAPDTISVLDLERGYRRTLISLPQSSVPRGIALDPMMGLMFWTDWGSPAKVERAYMDGTGRTTIADTDLVWPNDITIDYESHLLYWVDANLDKIESARYDGSDRKLVISTGVQHPFSITVFNGTLYWTDWQIDAIFMKSPQSRNSTVVYGGLGTEPMGIEAVSPSRQALATTPCDVANGNCEQLCLLSVNRTSSCACIDGYTLASDGRTCDPPPTTPTTITGTPRSVGSCGRAGYTDCCQSGGCHGFPRGCFCDLSCVAFQDCCEDFFAICETPTRPVITSSTGSSSFSVEEVSSSVILSPTLTTSVTGVTSSSSSSVEESSSFMILSPTVIGEQPPRSSATTLSSPPVPTMVTDPPQSTGTPDGAQISETAIRVGAAVGAVIIVVLLLILVLLIIAFIILKRRASNKYDTFNNPPEGTVENTSFGGLAFQNPVGNEYVDEKSLEMHSEKVGSE